MEPRSRRALSRRQSLERADAVRACSLTYQCGTCQVHRPTCAAACARRVVRGVCARRVRASCARGACARRVAVRASCNNSDDELSIEPYSICATNVAVRRDRFVWRLCACVQRADVLTFYARGPGAPRRRPRASPFSVSNGMRARSLRAVAVTQAVTSYDSQNRRAVTRRMTHAPLIVAPRTYTAGLGRMPPGPLPPSRVATRCCSLPLGTH